MGERTDDPELVASFYTLSGAGFGEAPRHTFEQRCAAAAAAGFAGIGLHTDDLARTRKALGALNTPFAETDVLVVELRNHPGALARVCELLGTEHVNIEYAYISAGGRNGKTLGVFKVSNSDKAMKVLAGPLDVNGRRRLEARTLRHKTAYAKPGGNAR